MSDSRVWMVRAGQGGRAAAEFIEESYVGVSWAELGELSPEASDEEIDMAYERAAPSKSAASRRSGASQLKRFLREIEIGDAVATYDPERRVYYLGEVLSLPFWDEKLALPRARRVRWESAVPRSELSTDARNSLGSISTLFQPSETACQELRGKAFPIGELEQHASQEQAGSEPLDPSGPEIESTDPLFSSEAIDSRAADLIEDRLAALDWEEMQELVAGLLRAMGYRTRVSPRGADRGVDVFASPDGLGLEEPRIFVEVKHRKNAMSAGEIRSFLGGRQPGDRCLYVSTGGFSKEAQYEADRSTVPLRLLAMPDLRELLLQLYDRIDDATQRLVPLRRVYWPDD